MESPAKSVKRDLLSILIEAGILNDEQLQRIEELKHKTGERVEHILLQQRMVTQQQLAFFTSLQLGIPFINLRRESIKADAVKLIPESVARKYGVIPVDQKDGTIIIAMEDPKDIEAIEDLTAITMKKIEPVISTAQDIQEMIDLNYRIGGELEEQLSQIPTRYRGGAGLREARVSPEAIAQAPVVRAIDLLIKQAVRDRASDVHVEPQEERLRVRYRIDGILNEVMGLPLSVHAPLLSRLKIMAGLNIAERRRSQDGQISFDMGDREVDIRVATSNTIYGEMAVLRILDKAFAFLPLPEIGFMPQILERYLKMLKTPFGMILISGPTGSGKTTTQYASVNTLDSVGRKIITIEDPVEYHFSNINQMQVNTAANVTFATGLRATMRLDPDVILVGEIRDGETAQISTQAALTGHLVLSSVHANDTVSTIIRMLDLGIEPFLIASALIGVVAQRMVRRICPYCSQPSEVTVGVGCNFCAGTGYLGRTGIFEVLIASETIRRMIARGTDSTEIRNQALKEGTASLWHDGMMKVKEGVTTPFEILRNVFSIS
jgi:general secretion pathway protein E